MRGRWHSWVGRFAPLRWLFLLRKTWLIKYWNVHYSQFGEDIVVGRFLKQLDPARSCYVDVGCYHPKKHSNTFRLYRQGWRGINVDVDQIKLDVFDLARPDDENVCCAVGDTPGTATLYRFGYYSLINTLDEAKANQTARAGHAYEAVPVRVRTLTDIIASSRFADRQVALLSIDVEGHEESVLRSLDFTRYRPVVILVEFHVSSLELIGKDRRFLLLTEELGYDMVNWVGLTVFFMDKTQLERIRKRTPQEDALAASAMKIEAQ